jgi:hypothetical protein
MTKYWALDDMKDFVSERKYSTAYLMTFEYHKFALKTHFNSNGDPMRIRNNIRKYQKQKTCDFM